MKTRGVEKESRETRRFLFAAAVLCLFQPALAATGPKILVEARVNGQPVKLVFDTGVEHTLLFRSTARRLGLAVTPPDPAVKAEPGRIVPATSEVCEFSLDRVTMRMALPIYDPPEGISYDIDGMLAWYPLRDHIFRISLAANAVETVEDLPRDLTSWAKWTLGAHKVLTIRTSESGGTPRTILFDTGSPSGVALNARRWQQWREEHRGAPATPVAFFVPGSGLLVREECWADRLDIAGFSVTDVPVLQGRPDAESVGEEAMLGLAALLRFEIIIDGAAGYLYTRAVATPPRPYNHNRLGAVFTPKNLESQDLIGYVVEGTPAYQAGIRNGDILLRIGTLDVTKWRTDPRVLPLTRFWEQPAGTELHLTLMREARQFECVVELRDILRPRRSP
jgi:hypothetical protein